MDARPRITVGSVTTLSDSVAFRQKYADKAALYPKDLGFSFKKIPISSLYN